MQAMPLRRETIMTRPLSITLRIAVPDLLLGLTACTTLGPDYTAPGAEVDSQWLAMDDPAFLAGKEMNSDWWTQFNDPVLDRLVQMAYEQNSSLQIAGLRIMEARAQLGVAIGSQYPQLQEAADALTRENLSENAPNFSQAADSNYWTANIGLNTSWEPDFWGRYRRGVVSASANLGSQIRRL
jgi:outer membrane protein TolC